MRARTPVSIHPADYPDVEIDDEDNPEWTEEDFARARPLQALLSELHTKQNGSEPIRAVPIRSVTLDLDARVVEAFQAQGPDWRDRMRAALSEAAPQVAQQA